MKTLVKSILPLFFLAVVFSNCMVDECASKKLFVKNFDSFIEEVSENHKEYSEKDWEKKDEKLNKYMDECYEKHEEDLTDKEKKEFWAKTVRYYIKKYGFNFQKFLDGEDNEITERFQEELNKLQDFSSEDFQEIFREVFKDDLSDLIDNALEGLEDIGNQLKEELNKEN